MRCASILESVQETRQKRRLGQEVGLKEARNILKGVGLPRCPHEIDGLETFMLLITYLA